MRPRASMNDVFAVCETRKREASGGDSRPRYVPRPSQTNRTIVLKEHLFSLRITFARGKNASLSYETLIL